MGVSKARPDGRQEKHQEYKSPNSELLIMLSTSKSFQVKRPTDNMTLSRTRSNGFAFTL
jgi:hypothetical protein